MTELEKSLLNELQKGIPIVEEPFRLIAKNLGVEQEWVIETVERLKEMGYIRRFGGILDVNKLGTKSTLVAMKVNHEDMEWVAGIISGYKGVTHNYERDDNYNLWFTLMEDSSYKLQKTIEEIKHRTGVEDVLVLPSVSKHKTKVFLRFE